MKNRYFVLLITLLLLCGCKKESSIKFNENEIFVASNGGEVSMSYMLENVGGTPKLQIKCAEEWIHSYNYATSGILKFYVDKNTDSEERIAVVEVSVQGSIDRFTVIQSCGVFEINPVSVKETSAQFAIIPQDPEMTYLVANYTMEEYVNDLNSSDQALYEDVIQYYTEIAKANGKSLEEYLSSKGILSKGNRTLDYKVISPDTEYMLFAVGVNTKGEKLSGLVKKNYKTLAPEKIPVEFNVEVQPTSSYTTVRISAIDKVPYIYIVADKQTVKDNGDTPTDFVQDYVIENLMYNVIDIGMPLKEAVKNILKNENVEIDYQTKADTDYYVLVCSLSEEGAVNSELSVTEFRTPPVQMSDIKFTVDVQKVYENAADLSISVTENSPYFMMVEKEEVFEGKSDIQIINEFLEMPGLQDYINQGNLSGKAGGLYSDTDYSIYLFGYEGGTATTGLTKIPFRTLPLVSSDGMTFEFKLEEAGETDLTLSVTGTPDKALFYWTVFEASTSDDEIDRYITMTIQQYVANGIVKDRAHYMRHVGSTGYSRLKYESLMYNTEYIIVAFGVDEITGKNTTPIYKSDIMKTKSRTVNDLSIDVKFDKYFDGNEIAEMYPDFDFAKGSIMLPVEVVADPDAAGYVYQCFQGDLSNESESKVISELNYQGIDSEPTSIFYLKAGEPATIFALALDDSGNYSKMYTKVITLTKDGVSPASEFEPYISYQASRSIKTLVKKISYPKAVSEIDEIMRIHEQINK